MVHWVKLVQLEERAHSMTFLQYFLFCSTKKENISRTKNRERRHIGYFWQVAWHHSLWEEAFTLVHVFRTSRSTTSGSEVCGCRSLWHRLTIMMTRKQSSSPQSLTSARQFPTPPKVVLPSGKLTCPLVLNLWVATPLGVKWPFHRVYLKKVEDTFMLWFIIVAKI